MPTTDRDEEEPENVYKGIEEATKHIQRENNAIIIEDWNVIVELLEQTVAGSFGVDSRNHSENDLIKVYTKDIMTNCNSILKKE